jgi:hypothetical protein
MHRGKEEMGSALFFLADAQRIFEARVFAKPTSNTSLEWCSGMCSTGSPLPKEPERKNPSGILFQLTRTVEKKL